MIRIRKAGERGLTNLGWLDSRHTFSFGGYHDPRHMGFRTLRVINDDRVLPGEGFGTHGHRDMEILTWVVDGSIAHRDSTGTERTLAAGGLQRMSAGRGIMHSEYNASASDPLRFLQIWILPRAAGLEPGYEEMPRVAGDSLKPEKLRLLASADGRNGSLTVNQDVDLWLATPGDGETVALRPESGHGAWVQVVRGSVALNGQVLEEGDGASLENEDTVEITGSGGPGEALVFDLA